MNTLTRQKRAAVIKALCDGNSIRVTARLTGTAKATVLRTLLDAGEFASNYQDVAHRNLRSTRLRTDEIWAFVGATKIDETKREVTEIWTYIAICLETKLVVTWLVGPRGGHSNDVFVADLAGRLERPAQFTSGDNGSLLLADKESGSKAHDLGLSMRTVDAGTGTWANDTDRHAKEIQTAQRSRPLGRRTDNYARAVSLFFFYHNYCRVNAALTSKMSGVQTTPAMAAGLTTFVWSAEDIVDCLHPSRTPAR